MSSNFIINMGRWAAGCTLVIGTFLLTAYFIKPDTEKGMAIYLFNVLAGIVNLAVLLIIIMAIYFSRNNNRKLLVTGGIVLLVNFLLFIVSFFYLYNCLFGAEKISY